MHFNTGRFTTMALLIFSASVSAQTAPLTVDGKDGDWPAEALQREKGGAFDYGVLQSGGNLYVLLRTGSPQVQAKMLKAGMTVFVDPEGKKKANTGLQFPLPKKEDDPSADMGLDMNALRLMGMAKSTEYSLKKFREGNGSYPLGSKNPAGVDVAMAIDDKGRLVYEALIPFAAFWDKSVPDASDRGRSIDVGIYINALPEPHALAGADGQQANGATPPGGTPFPRGSRGGGAAGAGLPDAAPSTGSARVGGESIQDAFKPTRVWQTMQIQ